jgi:hypothetical protein
MCGRPLAHLDRVSIFGGDLTPRYPPRVAIDERYTLAEAADLTGLTPRALARRIERGRLPATKGEDGKRYVSLRDLAAAGLLDATTKKRPAWADERLEPSALARAVIDELSARGLRIYQLEQRLAQLTDWTREQERQIEQARREREEIRQELRAQLEQARREREELRRRLEEHGA